MACGHVRVCVCVCVHVCVYAPCLIARVHAVSCNLLTHMGLTLRCVTQHILNYCYMVVFNAGGSMVVGVCVSREVWGVLWTCFICTQANANWKKIKEDCRQLFFCVILRGHNTSRVKWTSMTALQTGMYVFVWWVGQGHWVVWWKKCVWMLTENELKQSPSIIILACCWNIE